MSHVTFEHMKCMEEILAVHILHLRCMALYDSLGLEGERKDLGHDIFEKLAHIPTDLSTQAEQN